MVVGYYDGAGFPELVPGDASTQTDAVNAMIASAEHYEDYSLPLDYAPNLLPDKSSLGGAHVSSCLADFMNTSWSSRGNYYGWSHTIDVGKSFGEYVGFISPQYGATAVDYYPGVDLWSLFKQEIDLGRPAVL